MSVIAICCECFCKDANPDVVVSTSGISPGTANFNLTRNSGQVINFAFLLFTNASGMDLGNDGLNVNACAANFGDFTVLSGGGSLAQDTMSLQIEFGVVAYVQTFGDKLRVWIAAFPTYDNAGSGISWDFTTNVIMFYGEATLTDCCSTLVIANQLLLADLGTLFTPPRPFPNLPLTFPFMPAQSLVLGYGGSITVALNCSEEAKRKIAAAKAFGGDGCGNCGGEGNVNALKQARTAAEAQAAEAEL